MSVMQIFGISKARIKYNSCWRPGIWRSEGKMFARVKTNHVKRENSEDAIKKFREIIGTTAKQMAGFKGSYLLVDRKPGKMVGIALWEQKEDLEASANAAAQIRSQIFQATAATNSPIIEIFEVAAQE